MKKQELKERIKGLENFISAALEHVLEGRTEQAADLLHAALPQEKEDSEKREIVDNVITAYRMLEGMPFEKQNATTEEAGGFLYRATPESRRHELFEGRDD